MDAQRLKHLEFVQDIISRMNSNSFLIKGWSVTLIAAISTLAAAAKNNALFLPSLIPPLLFWLLDSYYLQQERKFRGLYNDIVNGSQTVDLFEIDPTKYEGGKYRYVSSFWSITLRLFYGGSIGILLVLYIILENL